MVRERLQYTKGVADTARDDIPAALREQAAFRQILMNIFRL